MPQCLPHLGRALPGGWRRQRCHLVVLLLTSGPITSCPTCHLLCHADARAVWLNIVSHSPGQLVLQMPGNRNVVPQGM